MLIVMKKSKDSYFEVYLKDGTCLRFDGYCNRFDYNYGNYCRFFNETEGLNTTLAMIPHESINYIKNVIINHEEET